MPVRRPGRGWEAINLLQASTAAVGVSLEYNHLCLAGLRTPALNWGFTVALTAHDRDLLRRCLHHEPGSWNDFVDRFLGLVYHVVQHTAHLRSFPLRPEDTEDVAAQVLLRIVENDYAALRQFRGQSSLATYLTVIARRTCVQELARRAGAEPPARGLNDRDEPEADETARPQGGLESIEEVAQLLKKLPTRERNVVRLFYLEGRSYEEISKELDLPINSIGAILSRARKKLRGDVRGAPPEINSRKYSN